MVTVNTLESKNAFYMVFRGAGKHLAQSNSIFNEIIFMSLSLNLSTLYLPCKQLLTVEVGGAVVIVGPCCPLTMVAFPTGFWCTHHECWWCDWLYSAFSSSLASIPSTLYLWAFFKGWEGVSMLTSPYWWLVVIHILGHLISYYHLIYNH